MQKARPNKWKGWRLAKRLRSLKSLEKTRRKMINSGFAENRLWIRQAGGLSARFPYEIYVRADSR